MFYCQATGLFRCGLRGIGSRLSGALEAQFTGRGPRDGVARRIGDGDNGIVEGCADMGRAFFYVLALTTSFNDLLCGSAALIASH